jgi:ACT domain-containing protein
MNTLERLLKTVIENNAEMLTIEYKDGIEEITAYSGGIGITIDTIKSNTKESESLFEEIRKIKRKNRIKIGKYEVLLRISSYDNFGEAAYEIRILRSPADTVH